MTRRAPLIALVAPMILTPMLALVAQSPSVTVDVGVSSASVGYYSDEGLILRSNGSREAMTFGAEARWRRQRALSLALGASLVARGFRSGGEWMNATYADVAIRGDLQGPGLRSRIRPYLGGGLSIGRRVACARGGTTVEGEQRDLCDSTGLAFPAVATWDVSREFRVGVRSRHLRVELIHSRSLVTFQQDPTGLDAKHGVWLFRVGKCVARC